MSSNGWLDLFAPRVLLESVNGGIDVRDFSQDLVSFKYVSSVRKMDKCTITISNKNMKYANDPRFDREMRMVCRWGYPGGLSSTKELVVVHVAPSLAAGVPNLVLTAYDSGQDLMSTGARNWGSVSSSAIASAIAARHGLRADVMESNDRRREHRVQNAYTTDYEFLLRLADRINYDFWCDAEVLHFVPVDTAALPRHRFVYFVDGSSTLKSFQPTVKKGKIHNRHVGGVDARGRSSVQSPVTRRTTELALARDSVRVINMQSATIGASAPTVANHLGDDVTAPSPETNAVVRSQHAASAQHKAEMSAVNMTATFVGYPPLLATDVIEVYVVERRYSGLWRAREITHTIDGNGYSTEAKLHRAEINASVSIAGATIPQSERNNARLGPVAQLPEATMRPIDLRQALIMPEMTIPRRSPTISGR